MATSVVHWGKEMSYNNYLVRGEGAGSEGGMGGGVGGERVSGEQQEAPGGWGGGVAGGGRGRDGGQGLETRDGGRGTGRYGGEGGWRRVHPILQSHQEGLGREAGGAVDVKDAQGRPPKAGALGGVGRRSTGRGFCVNGHMPRLKKGGAGAAGREAGDHKLRLWQLGRLGQPGQRGQRGLLALGGGVLAVPPGGARAAPLGRHWTAVALEETGGRQRLGRQTGRGDRSSREVQPVRVKAVRQTATPPQLPPCTYGINCCHP